MNVTMQEENSKSPHRKKEYARSPKIADRNLKPDKSFKQQVHVSSR